jgi:hypothetical protein
MMPLSCASFVMMVAHSATVMLAFLRLATQVFLKDAGSPSNLNTTLQEIQLYSIFPWAGFSLV